MADVANKLVTWAAYSGAANTFSAGMVRDVSGRLPDMIDPFDAPIYKAAKRKKAIGTRCFWQYDTLTATVGTTFAAAYGAEPTFATTTNRAEASNVIEAFLAPYSVTDIDEAQAANGGVDAIKSLAARALEQCWMRLTKSFEIIIASKQTQAINADDATTAKMDGLFTAISTNLTTLTGNDNTISEDDIIDKLDSMLTAGASKKLDLFANVYDISAFTKKFLGRQNARITTPSSEAEIKNFTDSYLAPSGVVVQYHPNRSMVENCGVLVLDLEHLFIRELIAPSVYRVTEAAGTNHKKGWIRAAWTLDYDYEKRHAAWKGLSCPLS